MKYYLIAGERSGDLHGGNLIEAIAKRDPHASFRGFGGDDMRQAGMTLVTHYRDMAFMGLAEVLANLRTLARKFRLCKEDMAAWKPDVVILIDYPGFNLRVARFARHHGIRVFWYISPKVWAWNQRRALKLKACVDRMFVILPFEKAFYRKFDWDVDYVGNPVLDAIRKFQPDPEFASKHQLNPDRLVAVLPGSRKQELIRMLPEIDKVCRKFPDLQFGVAAVGNLDPSLYSMLRSANVTLLQDQTYALLSTARAAIVTSGTATLEAALFNVPQVVVYRTSAVTYAIGKRLVDVAYISLVNLIANREVVKEFLQDEAGVENISAELNALLNDEAYATSMKKGYAQIREKIETPSASMEAAGMMVEDAVKNSPRKA